MQAQWTASPFSGRIAVAKDKFKTWQTDDVIKHVINIFIYIIIKLYFNIFIQISREGCIEFKHWPLMPSMVHVQCGAHHGTKQHSDY